MVPSELRGTFGGVSTLAEGKSRQALMDKGLFGPHSVYVCGTPIINSQTQIITLACSSENLLANAYRQQFAGLPRLVCVDATHRLVLEGHCNLLFGTVDASQKFHIIGYGVCSKEDTAAHVHILRCLKTEVERVVAMHQEHQTLI